MRRRAAPGLGGPLPRARTDKRKDTADPNLTGGHLADG